MEQFTVGKNEDGRRLDAVVLRILPKAGKGFVYKMLRKKNIVLNDKKAEGNDRVSEGDVIRFYLSEETYREFGGLPASGDKIDMQDVGSGRIQAFADKNGKPEGKSGAKAHEDLQTARIKERIIYEDDDIILIDKPAGILSQKADTDDISINEIITAYLLENGKIDERSLRTFRPSVCNRLDRNTSGIICAGVSLAGSRELTRLIRERRAEKYYLCIVCGELSCSGSVRLKSFLSKDEKNNKVTISEKGSEGAVPVEIEYMKLRSIDGFTLLKVRLITGKSHQIRAQLAAIGHPIAGDIKYGNRTVNARLIKEYGVKRQLLTAYSFVFPEDTTLEPVRGKTFEISVPEDFFIKP